MFANASAPLCFRVMLTTEGILMKDAGGQGLAPPLHPWPGLHFLIGVFGNQGQHMAYPHAW